MVRKKTCPARADVYPSRSGGWDYSNLSRVIGGRGTTRRCTPIKRQLMVTPKARIRCAQVACEWSADELDGSEPVTQG